MKRIDVIRTEVKRCFASQVRNYECKVVRCDDSNFFDIDIKLGVAKDSTGYYFCQLDLSKIINLKQRLEKLDFRVLPWQVNSVHDDLFIYVPVRSNIYVEND